MPKTESELREKLAEQLNNDVRGNEKLTFSKAAICATLPWALGENDDDRWFIRAKPGPPELKGAPRV